MRAWPYETADLRSVDAGLWMLTHDGDPRAFELATHHYTFHHYTDRRRDRDGYRNRRLFVGPGEKLVLLTHDALALFVWRRFISKDGQAGVNCAVFRNEGAFCGQVPSSRLILAAEVWARARWGEVRLYTYVDPRRVRSGNPGFCFKAAGWRRCGVTNKRRLWVFEKEACHAARVT
ncbi:MAG: hypothetical protein U0X20_22070 [Caldilineaceae bacterium]